MPKYTLHTDSDGDFVITKDDDILQVKLPGYDQRPITDEEVTTIKEQINLHGKENLSYNGTQVELKKTKEKSNGN